MEKEVDPSFHLEQSNYNMFVKKAKGKSVLMFFYVSADSSSQSLSLQFFQTALAFKSLHSLLFASVDCSENRNLCSYYSIRMVPEMKLVPSKGVSFDDKTLDFQHGEQLDSYLNRYLGTFLSMSGGLNERYGRDSVLDDLAHSFMNVDANTECKVGRRVDASRCDASHSEAEGEASRQLPLLQGDEGGDDFGRRRRGGREGEDGEGAAGNGEGGKGVCEAERNGECSSTVREVRV